jgi:hypothetical protein
VCKESSHFPLIITPSYVLRTSRSLSHPSEVSEPKTTTKRDPSKPRKLPLSSQPTAHTHTPTHTHTVSLPPVPCRTTKARLHPSVHALRSPQESPAASPPSQSLARPPARRNDHPSNMQDSKSKATWRWPFSANHSVPTTPFIIPFPSLGCCCCVAGRQSVRPSFSAVHRRRAGCCVSGGVLYRTSTVTLSLTHSIDPSLSRNWATGGGRR